ncbi:hypothetical protein [Bradyrhizobium sp. SYSU BS000235]|uniref:hypothetical protein n=1 Tax=Bradyrhizobium sp. SYSU BS000235 TaxID=3411332 RepID=UPI003C784242
MPETFDSYTFDVRGLLAWSKSSGNQFAVAKADIDSGSMRVFSCAYNEFCKVYDDEAKNLKGIKFKKESLTEEHRESILAVAESAQATFGLKGPYDKAVEWQIAGAASCEGLIVVTDERGKTRYSKIDGIVAITFDEFLNRHEV